MTDLLKEICVKTLKEEDFPLSGRNRLEARQELGSIRDLN